MRTHKTKSADKASATIARSDIPQDSRTQYRSDDKQTHNIVPNRLMTIEEFCQRNLISRSTYHYLRQADRAPATITIGKLVRISEKSEGAWREEMASRPILNIRAAGQAAQRQRARA